MNLSTTTPFRNASTAGTALTSKRLTNLKQQEESIRLNSLKFPRSSLTLCLRQHRRQPDQFRYFLPGVLSSLALISCTARTNQRGSSRALRCQNWWPVSCTMWIANLARILRVGGFYVTFLSKSKWSVITNSLGLQADNDSVFLSTDSARNGVALVIARNICE